MGHYIYSFFSGAGGLDLGLRQAGLNVLMSHDNDLDCVATHRLNGSPCDPRDAQYTLKYGIDMLNRLLMGEELFAIVGGPPCQSFSVAGNQRGFSDSRGSLIDVYLDIIKGLRPRFFVLENVPRLATIPYNKYSENPAERERGSALNHILQRIEADLEYGITWGILNASLYGSAQNRERFVLIGARDDEEILIPEAPVDTPVSTLRDAIEDLMDIDGSDYCTQFSEKTLRFLRHVPEGGNWRDMPRELWQEAMGNVVDEHGRSNGGCTGFYRRLAWDKPSPTLVTSPTQRATMLCHPSQDRPLSVLEYARIQGFPDDYRFAGSLASRYRQIGNAVPVHLARAIGEALLNSARYNDRQEAAS